MRCFVSGGNNVVFTTLNITLTINLTNANSTGKINVANRTTTTLVGRRPRGFNGSLVLRLLPNARKLCNFIVKFLVCLRVSPRVAITRNLCCLVTNLPVTVANLASNVTRNHMSATNLRVLTGERSRGAGKVVCTTVIRACTVLKFIVSFLVMLGTWFSGTPRR